MTKTNTRDDFSENTKRCLAMRAAFFCSNPDCRTLTSGPSDANQEKYIYTGEACHITGAARNGPRYDPSLAPEERSSIENGIFLCANCAEMIDKNDGLDYPVELLREWKRNHEKWLKENPGRNPIYAAIPLIDGEHIARGKSHVTAIDVQGPVIFKPGTRSVAEGENGVTATRIK